MVERDSVEDLEAAARRILPPATVAYIAKKSDRGQTLTDNVNAFKRIRLRPRLLRDVSVRDTSTTILGQKVPFPIAIAPTALHHWVHPEGERLTAKAAESMKTGMVVSMWSGTSLEEITKVAPDGLRWLHITPLSDRNLIKRIVQKAEKAGCKGVFVTLDSAGRSKERIPLNISKLYRRTPVTYKHFEDSDVPLRSDTRLEVDLVSNLTWEILDWLKSITTLPIVGKGILTGICIWHLPYLVQFEKARSKKPYIRDSFPSQKITFREPHNAANVAKELTEIEIDALSEVVEAVRGTGVEVYLDGGLRLGTDVLKAIALGARAVFIGRPILWGLGLDGESGVKRVLKILQEEFDIALAMTGCRSVAEIDPTLVKRSCCCNCASKL